MAHARKLKSVSANKIAVRAKPRPGVVHEGNDYTGIPSAVHDMQMQLEFAIKTGQHLQFEERRIPVGYTIIGAIMASTLCWAGIIAAYHAFFR